MRNLIAIWRRELSCYFLSPVAYVVMVAFLMASGLTFMIEVLHSAETNAMLSDMLYASLVLWSMVLITVVCMRLFAEEKREGTLETLMTAPVTDRAVVLGKYWGAFSFLIIATLPAVASVFILAAFNPGVDFIDYGALLAGWFIFLLVTAFCVAVGLVVSLTTRNQVVAAICCFCAVWLVLLAGWLIAALPFGFDAVGEYCSALAHVEDFARGLVDTRPIVLYISGTVLMLFIATRMLESRRWR